MKVTIQEGLDILVLEEAPGGFHLRAGRVAIVAAPKHPEEAIGHLLTRARELVLDAIDSNEETGRASA